LNFLIYDFVKCPIFAIRVWCYNHTINSAQINLIQLFKVMENNDNIMKSQEKKSIQ